MSVIKYDCENTYKNNKTIEFLKTNWITIFNTLVYAIRIFKTIYTL